jgi:hypothetical protein
VKSQGGNWGTLNRALVRGIDPHGVLVEVPALAPGGIIGPIPTAVANLAIGEAVLVANISTSRDSLVVLGRVPGRADTVGEIPTLSATIAALQATDTAIQAAATTLAGRVTTAEGNIASNTSRLTTDEANILANTNSINAHTTRLNTDEANITTNATNITTANTNITNLTTRVTALEDTTAVGRTRTVWQSADQIQNNANGGTTYTSSTYLTLPVLAGGVYWAELDVLYDCLPASQIKLKLNATATSTLRVNPWFSGDPAGNSAIWHDVFDGFEFVPGGKTGGGMMSCRPHGLLIVGGTGGSFTLQFAQNVADIAYALLLARSTMRLTRLA